MKILFIETINICVISLRPNDAYTHWWITPKFLRYWFVAHWAAKPLSKNILLSMNCMFVIPCKTD